MEVHLRDKVAVITGAAGGIGLKIAEVFGLAGAGVAICDLREPAVSGALAELEAKGISAYGRAVDVADRGALFALADEVEGRFGGIDIWVSNAAVFYPRRIIDMPEEEWRRIMDVNIGSVYYGALIAAQKMPKRGGGVLIHAASFASLVPAFGSGAYAASKAAVYSMTRSLAAELAPLDIRVIGYIPGVIETEMTAPTIRARKDALVSQLALRRIGTSQDVAEAVLFMASDRASYMTGTFIEIAGGKLCVQNPADAWA